MQEYYTIEYLSQKDINFTNNTLHAVTDSRLFKELVHLHKIELEVDHAHNVTCKRNQILDYNSNLEITREALSSELDKIRCAMEDVKYINLIKRSVQ